MDYSIIYKPEHRSIFVNW